MSFSERNPKLFISAEEKIRKQTDARGLDYDAIKKETENGLVYEVDFFGILRFGQNYALKITPAEPEFIDYKDIFWAFEEKGGVYNDLDCIAMVFLDGNDTEIELKDKNDGKIILDMIKKASPDTLIGYTEENKKKYEALKAKLNIKDKTPVRPTTPEPAAKLPKSKVDSLHKKIERIISQSKELTEIDKKWYCKIGEPVNEDGMKAINAWCEDNGVHLPEAFTVFLTHANSFCVDYSWTVGYFTISGFDTEMTTKERYGRTKEAMLAREYDAYENCQSCFGWLGGQCLYYNPYTGEIYLENERNKFTPVKDFEKEILDKVIAYLEKKSVQYERKEELLKENADTPMREEYDELLEYMKNDDGPNSGIVVYAPLTRDEISDWEKAHNMKLPEDYVNWLLLSDGAVFANKSICKLDEVDTKHLAIDPDSGRGYVIIASLSGYSDCLVFDPETSELFVFDDDGDVSEGDFVYDIFEKGFEYLDER